MRLYLGLLLIGMGLGGCTPEISQVETATSISTAEGTNNTSNEPAPTLTEPNSKDLEASSILPEKQVSKHVALKSCNDTSSKTVYWKAIDQEVQLITNLVLDNNTQLRTATLNLNLEDGTTLNLGKASFEKDQKSNPNCVESLMVSTYSTIESLMGQREFSNEDIYFKNYSDLYKYNAVALECHQPSIPTFHPPVPYENQTDFCKTAIDHWNVFSEYGRLTKRHSATWTNQRNQQFVSLKAPIVYVARSKSCTDILVYDPIEKIMRLVMPNNLKCMETGK